MLHVPGHVPRVMIPRSTQRAQLPMCRSWQPLQLAMLDGASGEPHPPACPWEPAGSAAPAGLSAFREEAQTSTPAGTSSWSSCVCRSVQASASCTHELLLGQRRDRPGAWLAPLWEDVLGQDGGGGGVTGSGEGGGRWRHGSRGSNKRAPSSCGRFEGPRIIEEKKRINWNPTSWTWTPRKPKKKATHSNVIYAQPNPFQLWIRSSSAHPEHPPCYNVNPNK